MPWIRQNTPNPFTPFNDLVPHMKIQKTKQKQKTNTKNTKMSRNNLEMTFMNILYKH